MAELAVLVPVLGRPQRVRPLLESIHAATPKAHVLFLADPRDQRECAEIRRARRDTPLRVDADAKGGSYAAKINRGVRVTKEPLLFLGADDLDFKAGWFEEAERKLAMGADVVGVNDLIERDRSHATHFLMTREYAEQPTIDGNPGPLHEGYDHSFVDDELIATAKHRGVYAFAKDAHVRHLHPDAGTAPWDDTYRKGRERMRLDARVFRRRAKLWAT